MTDRLTIAAVQANPTVGAIEANAKLAAERLEQATAAGADLAVRPLDAEAASREIVVAWRAGSTRAAEGRLLAEVFSGRSEG